MKANSNLNRLKTYAEKYMLCFITAYHEKYSMEDNQRRQERLSKQLQYYGFGWITAVNNNNEILVVINCHDKDPMPLDKFIQCMTAACTEYKQDSILITLPPYYLKRVSGKEKPKLIDPWNNVLIPGHVYCYNRSAYSLPEDKGLISTSNIEQWEYFESDTPKKNLSRKKENTSIYDLSWINFNESSFKLADIGMKYRTHSSTEAYYKYWNFGFPKFFKASFKDEEGINDD